MSYAKLPEGFSKPIIPPKRWFEDEKWLFEHENELAEKYPDRWVAVVNKEVVAAGKNLAEVERMAREKTGEEEFPVWLVESGCECSSPWRVLRDELGWPFGRPFLFRYTGCVR